MGVTVGVAVGATAGATAGVTHRRRRRVPAVRLGVLQALEAHDEAGVEQDEQQKGRVRHAHPLGTLRAAHAQVMPCDVRRLRRDARVRELELARRGERARCRQPAAREEMGRLRRGHNEGIDGERRVAGRVLGVARRRVVVEEAQQRVAVLLLFEDDEHVAILRLRKLGEHHQRLRTRCVAVGRAEDGCARGASGASGA